MQETIETTLTVTSHDLSIWGLFLAADIVVKAVMLMLVIASLWTWAIIFEKLRTIGREFRYADDFEDEFWSGGALDQLYDTLGPEPDGIMARVFSAAMREWRRATARGNAGGNGAQYLGQRIDRTMSVTIARELAFIEKGMTFLASVGSVAPFVGPFWHGLGDHELVSVNRPVEKHVAGGCCAGHCRSSFCNGTWSCCCHPCRGGI